MNPTDPLLRPVWSALVTTHAPLAEGNGRARRYPAAFGPFAATIDDQPDSLAAIAALVPPGDGVALFTASPIAAPLGLTPMMTGRAHQMVAATMEPVRDGAAIGELGADDSAEMAALVALTKPGPFAPRTRELGRYLGIRIDGQLAAMAGERLRCEGAVAKFTAMEGFIADAVQKGASVKAGGKRIANKGNFSEPTVLACLSTKVVTQAGL